MENDDQQQSGDNAAAKLEDIRKQALEALVPMADELDETPERKFEILMTAARFSDKTELLESALKAALSLPDSAPKAEALIDLVNEVNFRLQPS